jgi:hypothetical protein
MTVAVKSDFCHGLDETETSREDRIWLPEAQATFGDPRGVKAKLRVCLTFRERPLSGHLTLSITSEAVTSEAVTSEAVTSEAVTSEADYCT